MKTKKIPDGFCTTCKSFICCGCAENASACACPPWKGKFDESAIEDEGPSPHYGHSLLSAVLHSVKLPAAGVP